MLKLPNRLITGECFKLKYELYSGAGNDFVIINNFPKGISKSEQKELTIKLCSESFPEIDGVIFAEKPVFQSNDVRMTYYNRDGSFGAMCGNGARCTAMFAYKHGIINKKDFLLEAVDDIYTVKIINEEIVNIGFPEPKEIITNIAINAELNAIIKTANVSYADVGSNHIVIFIDEEINKLFLDNKSIEHIDVNGIGKVLRFHKNFSPRGANVNFAEIESGNLINLRTYERGVERETLACGTGIISTGIVAMLEKGFSSPVNIKVQSGEVLEVTASINGRKISELSLMGSAKKFGEGEIKNLQ